MSANLLQLGRAWFVAVIWPVGTGPTADTRRVPCLHALGTRFVTAWFPALAIVLIGTIDAAAVEQRAVISKEVAPFLKQHCTVCHGAEQQKGERRFDDLPAHIADDNTLVDYQDILDQLNLGEMPPADAKQPTNDSRLVVIRSLTNSIQEYHQTRANRDDEAVLRRLNAREYRNTVRDLLHLNMTMFDPTVFFPRDQTTEHLDNNGESLVTSGHLLHAYLNSAEQVVEKAMSPLEKPKVRTWKFDKDLRQQPEIDQVHRKTNKFQHLTLYDVVGADKPEGAYAPIHAFAQGVPHDGFYELRLHAEAVNRLHPYDDSYLGRDREEPLRVGIVAGHRDAGLLHLPQPMEPLLAELDLADGKEWYTVRIWLDKGFTPRFTFRNGLMDARNLWSRIQKKYPDKFPERKTSGIVEARFNAIKYGKLPHIRIHEIEIKGPFYDEWPTPAQRAIFGDAATTTIKAGELSEQQMRENLRVFASRAYRRPATDEDIDRVMTVIAAQRRSGRTSLQAYGDGVKTILCSPNFLFLEQPADKKLTPHALASRLSYFLWSSMPDEELLQLAVANKLQQPAVLKSQVERMLNDEKSNAFVGGFLDSWLTLSELGATPPDRSQFRAFYQYDLDTAMRKETHLFSGHLIDENLPIANYLDSDFAFVNKALAHLYGIEPPRESGFHKVQISDRRRGGLLGQAAILTVTANGIDTSPVNRGVWILENVLGTPPSPPPPDIEPLDPDIRGAKSIRDQLQKHRDSPTCFDCHRKIDPLGFALENFDPIGRWRTSYGKRVKIDAAGELPNGKRFQDVVGLKETLLEQEELFARALTTKLMAYATGRHITPLDRPHVDEVLATTKRTKHRFRDIIKQIVASEPFRSK